jgi:hypothetical protein
MPSYDPKRPRPSAATADDVAPIEAILDPTPAEVATVDVEEEAPIGTPDEVDLRVEPGPRSPASVQQTGGSEVPVAPAPEENTANRAVVAAVLVGVAAILALIFVMRRRRG